MNTPAKLALLAALGLFGLGVLQLTRGPADTGPDLLPRLNDSTFTDTLAKATTPVLVDFYADWCGPCRAIKPIVDALAATNATRLAVYKVNVDHAPQTANANRISGIPCLVLYRNGQEIDRQVGAQSQKAYQAWLNPHLPKP